MEKVHDVAGLNQEIKEHKIKAVTLQEAIKENQELTEKLKLVTEERDNLLSAYQDALGLSPKYREKYNKDVHTEHCCQNCGCKYGEKDCTVVTGQKIQSFPCGKQGVCGGW